MDRKQVNLAPFAAAMALQFLRVRDFTLKAKPERRAWSDAEASHRRLIQRAMRRQLG